MGKDSDPVAETSSVEQSEITEAEIDQTLKESFPASDPPPWTLGVDPHTHPKQEEDNKDRNDDPARLGQGGN